MGEKKEEQKVEEKEQENTVSLEDMEKSWNDSRAAVLDLLGVEPSESESVEKTQKSPKADEDLSKADKDTKKKKKDMDYKEEEDEEDEEDEEAKKSLEESMSEESDAEQAMDIEPFLRQLIKGLDVKFSATNKALASLQKSVERNGEIQKATAKMFAAYGELQKAMADTVEKIGNTPVKSGSILSKAGGDRFESAKGEEAIELTLPRDKILEKALKLRAKGKLDMRDVTKIENRVNKGIDLPEHIKKLLMADEED